MKHLVNYSDTRIKSKDNAVKQNLIKTIYLKIKASHQHTVIRLKVCVCYICQLSASKRVSLLLKRSTVLPAQSSTKQQSHGFSVKNLLSSLIRFHRGAIRTILYITEKRKPHPQE